MALMPTLGLRSCATERRQAPPLHETIKSGSATGAGIAAELRGDPKRKNQNPSKKEEKRAGAGCKPHHLPRGEGREFLLDILFHRMSEMAFYEKVIKVKADVAAYLINWFPSA